MQNTVYYIIIGIIVASYIFERILSYLNSKAITSKLPAELDGIYDDEKYKKSQQYKKVNEKYGIITSTFSFILIMIMLLANGFAYVDGIVRSITVNPILITILFFGILLLVSDILNIPFSIYDVFVIEEKYGFNKTSVKTYIFDKIKGWVLGIIIGGGIMAAVVWIYLKTGQYFWLITWVVLILFSVFMNMFYSTLIVPLFNKQTPLEEGELRNEIQKMADKTGFKLDNIFLIDGSKRSTKANAYFMGFGPKKRIVLYDTLLNELTNQEIVGVLAHEIGHYKLKHNILSIIISFIQTGITLYILSMLIDNPLLYKALGAKEPGFHLALITFGILYSPISSVVGLGMNVLSRRNEYAADAFAKKYYDGEMLISSLKKLSSSALSNLTPHPLYVFFHYSHPTLLQRIRAIRK